MATTTTMSVSGAAAALGVHVNTIRNWINSGQMGYVQRGSQKLPLAADVQARMDEFEPVDLRSVIDDLETRATLYETRAGDLRALAKRLREDLD